MGHVRFDEMEALSSARRLWNSPPRLVLVDQASAWAATTAQTLSKTAACKLLAYNSLTDAAASPALAHRPDVVALALSPAADALALWGRLVAAAPHLQFLWVADSSTSPWMQVMNSVFRDAHVVTRDDFLRHVGTALPHLVIRARAHHLLSTAADRDAPTADVARPVIQTSLHMAETYFREAYLRALVSKGGSLRALAARAGVAVSTLHSMLVKLGISVR